MIEDTNEEKSYQSEPESTGRIPSRRDLLRAVGATAAVGIGVGAFSGSAVADSCGEDVDDPEVVFCGCSQVCWCIPFCSVAVVHTEEEWFAYTDDPEDSGLEPKGGEYETKFCYEVGDDVDIELDGEKIIAVEVFNTDGRSGTGSDGWGDVTVFENPNTCAERSLDEIDIADRIDKREDLDDENVSTTEGARPRDVPGGCGEPPCDHPARNNGDGGGPPAGNNDGRGR